MKYIFAFSLALILTACSDDPFENVLSEDFYSLRSIYCECLPAILEPGEHEWQFDFEAEEITIKNNTDKHPEWLVASGTYPMVVDGDFITWNDQFFKVTTTDSTLTMNSNWAKIDGELVQFVDAPIYSFEKN